MPRKDKPSRTPIDINKDAWFYEDEKSLHFICWVTSPTDGQKVAASFTVPWSKLAKSYPARAARSRGEGMMTHWMTLQMGEITLVQIELGRMWVEVDSHPHSIPVAKTVLHKLFDAAEKGLLIKASSGSP